MKGLCGLSYFCRCLPHLPQYSLLSGLSYPQLLHLTMPGATTGTVAVVFAIVAGVDVSEVVLGVRAVFGRLVRNTKMIMITIITKAITSAIKSISVSLAVGVSLPWVAAGEVEAEAIGVGEIDHREDSFRVMRVV